MGNIFRIKGSLSKKSKQAGKEETIMELLSKDISLSAIARILGFNRLTVRNFIESRRINVNTNLLKRNSNDN